MSGEVYDHSNHQDAFLEHSTDSNDAQNVGEKRDPYKDPRDRYKDPGSL